MESITLQTGDSIITSGDILGKLQFAASDEGDAVGRLLSASIYAQAESAFTSAGNATSLVFSTSSNDTNPTVARLKVSPDGDFLPVVDATYDIGASSLRFQDAYFSGGVFLSDTTPPVTTNKLYNSGGSLYFNGSAVGGGGGTTYTAGSGITIDASDNIHVFGGTGNFRSISMTSHTPSPNTAQLYWDGTDIRFAGTKLTQISNPNASMVGKIPYFNSTSAITWDDKLSWDANSNRLGVGTDSPQREIHIVGSNTWGRLDRNHDSYGAAFLMTRGNGAGTAVQQSWLFGLPNIAGLSTGADHFVIVDFGTAVGGTTGDVRLLVDKTTGSVGIGEISVDAQLHVKSNSSTKIGSIVQGAASQSANLQEWQDSSQTTLSSMSSSGVIEARGYKTNSNMIITESGATRTLSASDNGKIILCTNTITITMPTGLDVGFSVTVIQGGDGQVTFNTSGTSLRNRQNHSKTADKYAIVSLIQLATNEFYLAGDTSL